MTRFWVANVLLGLAAVGVAAATLALAFWPRVEYRPACAEVAPCLSELGAWYVASVGAEQRSSVCEHLADVRWACTVKVSLGPGSLSCYRVAYSFTSTRRLPVMRSSQVCPAS